ncbi:hypothetical protein V494_00819 [Pseudogymnoascus sp. VKM F-4513 (FW-928)]|nr:hypothetical protein V494_00819 [Pseudogymnoascus sp. VKM F-4513 (FW-928)]
MRSSLFLLVAGAIGFASAIPQVDNVTDCKDGSELVSCIQPVMDAYTANTCKTTSCACDLLKTELDCFKNYCPEQPIPSRVTDGYNSGCSGDKGAAGMLTVPAAGLVAGVVGVVAML